MLVTGWSLYALWRTTNIRDRMFHLIENAGTPCHIDLYSQYFARIFALQVRFMYYLIYFSYILRSLACRLSIACGCAFHLNLPLLASVQGLSLTPPNLRDGLLLTYARCIAPRLLDASVRRRISCGCTRWVLSNAAIGPDQMY